MTTDFETALAQQREQLLDFFARLAVSSGADIQLPDPDPGSPLAEVVIAARVVAENLAVVARERDETLRQLRDQLSLAEMQSHAILELSTPVVEVWDEILVAPIIGTIDTGRAQQIIQNLLAAIVEHRATVVILDITGVPVVDTKVASHFLKTIEAARLLGAQVLLTGVSPQNAQTMVRLGVDLSRISTKGSLKAALQRAFELTQQRVTKEG